MIGPEEWDSWDLMRARSWDLGVDNLPDLLLALGLAKLPLPVQRSELKSWLGTPAAMPCPPALKADAAEFADGGSHE
jgi:hypothetical protein